MGTNYGPLLADIFLYSYEAEFIQSLLSTGKKKVYISVQLHIQIHRWRINNQYPRFWELYGSDVSRWAWDQRHDGEQHLCFLQMLASLYDKRDDFIFHITNFLFLRSNIPSSPAYGVFISQLIRACSSYECFNLRAARLSPKFLGQGYVSEQLKSSLRKLYDRYWDLIKYYEVSLSQMLHDILEHDHIQWHPQLIRL